MSTTTIETPTSPSRDAAAMKEREERLQKARKKLKSYRARQSKGSTASTSSSVGSSMSHTRRDSSQSTSTSASHRKSLSRSSGVFGGVPASPARNHGHGRKVSMSRASRGGSISKSISGHGHTRSRASVSISVSAPSPVKEVQPPAAPAPDEEASPPAPLSAPMSWTSSGGSSNGSFPTTPNPPPPSSSSRASHHATNSSLSYSTNAAAGPSSGGAHNRRASRHNRRSSVANFRESLEVVSGQGQVGQIQPAVSSFAATADSPPSPSVSNSNNSRAASPAQPSSAWTNDPAKVLEALKERGRIETDANEDPEKTRMDALEALEGRLAEPSPIIDLGDKAEGELMHAPPSPGYTAGGAVLPPASPAAVFSSPMVGLGLGTNKRNSWSAPGPVTAAGAKGAMDLGMLAEEDEEEEEEAADGTTTPLSKSTSRRSSRNGSPRKQRPASLFLPTSSPDLSKVAVGDDETPLTSGFVSRPMRLSLSLSSTASSEGTPSTAASFASAQPSRPAPVLRSLTLGASTPTTAPIPEDATPSPSSPGEKRSVSLFHSVAVAQASGQAMARTGSHSPTPPPASKGLRSLSIGGAHSPATTTSSEASPRPVTRRASTTGPGPRGAQAKRSSISYRTTSVSSLASPDGPLSATAQAARRPWRTSISSSGTSISSPSTTTPSSTIGGYAFPFVPSHGNMGGFGDLEIQESDAESPMSPPAAASQHSDDPEVLVLQLNGLRSQMEQMKQQSAQVSSTHQLEIAEFEKKAGEEARGMRMRIGELERQMEEGRVGRRFEVEGLSREIEQAREAISDLTEERDSLREDVEGWRARCTSLEAVVKKDREDDALATAQAKLIGEMRDQIYNLVAALERERGEHAETRQEVDRLLAGASPRSHDDVEAGAGIPRHHTFNNISDGSVLTTSSFGRSFSGNTTEDTSITTDLDDSFSNKMSSPSSGHSSFGQAIGFPAGTKSRDSDYGAAALDTLAEEEEEDEEAGIGMKADRATLGSGSTGTASSDNMPLTPNKEASMAHQRSDSFVRHWSFPKGSVSSVRISVDDHSFFDLGRHTSLPALPIPDSILPPFLNGDLTVDEEQEYEPVQHIRRPSSPRPLDRMQPHTRRFSGQYGKVPPVSPSALAHAALQAPVNTPSKLSKLSFGNLIGTLGGWSPAAVPAPAGLAKLAIASTHEEDEEDVFISATHHQTPPSLLHSSQPRPRYIKPSQQPKPKASRLGLLDFTPICCADEAILMI